ncbi:MAG: hypothetical protein OXU96_01715 [Gammaproteobacteria bacterium]|nr:hypothetical protein [Gammaproteobacteria bacterium]
MPTLTASFSLSKKSTSCRLVDKRELQQMLGPPFGLHLFEVFVVGANLLFRRCDFICGVHGSIPRVME